MPTFALRPIFSPQPVAGLIAREGQVQTLSARLAGRGDLMLAMGDGWLAAYSFHTEVNLPWLPDRPLYLYALAPGLLCQVGLEPNLPAPHLPALVRKLAPKGDVAITDGPMLWDLSAAIPVEDCNLRALR